MKKAFFSCVWILVILGLQPRDKAAMLVVNTKEIFLQNLHQNRVHFPAERNAFVLDHQHGCRDVTCKPAIAAILNLPTCLSMRTHPPPLPHPLMQFFRGIKHKKLYNSFWRNIFWRYSLGVDRYFTGLVYIQWVSLGVTGKNERPVINSWGGLPYKS